MPLITEARFRLAAAAAGRRLWGRLLPPGGRKPPPARIVRLIESAAADGRVPPFLPDLARLELAWDRVRRARLPARLPRARPVLNPTLQLVKTGWRLAELFASEAVTEGTQVERGEEWSLAWRHPDDGRARFRRATAEDLLVIKMLVDGISREEASAAAPGGAGVVERALARAGLSGIVIHPPSRIRRPASRFTAGPGVEQRFIASNSFTLQWHITNACDLRCRHCYDRSQPSPLTVRQGVRVLDSLSEFCTKYRVRGHVCFTGGNPFMYAGFEDLWRAAADRGFFTSILGNPVARRRLDSICAIQPPSFYQVSIEGLPPHNDHMRGAGHFEKTLEFLKTLREMAVPSQVMLTLTRENIDQVLPIAERLRGLADDFTFNRLAQVGEGAALAIPDRNVYAAFLRRYVAACSRNPILALKDSLINIVREERGEPLFGGCTGHGCGAAFNFIALLPDGEAHACRKFPSPIGNVLSGGVIGVYETEAARRYRNGCAACKGCRLRAVCGSCMAVTYGRGDDPFLAMDSHCFYESAPRAPEEGIA